VSSTTGSSITGSHSVRLGDLTWTEVHRRTTPPVLLIPVGSTEQHGPHLPISTDSMIAEALCSAVARDVCGTESTGTEPPCLIGPTLQVTASGEHAGFAGTLSIGSAVTEHTLIELARSADWARGLILVNGHGGNLHSVSAALTLLAYEQRQVFAWWPRIPGGDLHAGDSETSIMLHLHPELVRTELIEPGTVDLGPEGLKRLQSEGVSALSSNGVLGDPRPASASTGKQLFNMLRDDLLFSYHNWFPADALPR
jgi:mycofactocin precursor peptide peptidase